MKNRVLTFLFLLCLSTGVMGQFFIIPIVIPYQAPPTEQYGLYYCRTRIDESKKYTDLGLGSLETNKNASIAYFKAAILKDSTFCDAYDLTSACYRDLDQYDSAIKYIDLSLEVNNSNFWAKKFKGLLLLETDQLKEVINYYNQLIHNQPEESYWFFGLSNALIEDHQLDSAIKLVFQTQFKMKKNGDAFAKETSYFLQGKIAVKQKRFKYALDIFDTIYEIYRKDPDYCYNCGLSNLYLEKPRIHRAKRYFKKAKRHGFKMFEPAIVDQFEL